MASDTEALQRHRDRLIARRKLRRHAKRSPKVAAGRNGLDPLLLFERALLMVIG